MDTIFPKIFCCYHIVTNTTKFLLFLLFLDEQLLINTSVLLSGHQWGKKDLYAFAFAFASLWLWNYSWWFSKFPEFKVFLKSFCGWYGWLIERVESAKSSVMVKWTWSYTCIVYHEILHNSGMVSLIDLSCSFKIN